MVYRDFAMDQCSISRRPGQDSYLQHLRPHQHVCWQSADTVGPRVQKTCDKNMLLWRIGRQHNGQDCWSTCTNNERRRAKLRVVCRLCLPLHSPADTQKASHYRHVCSLANTSPCLRVMPKSALTPADSVRYTQS